MSAAALVGGSIAEKNMRPEVKGFPSSSITFPLTGYRGPANGLLVPPQPAATSNTATIECQVLNRRQNFCIPNMNLRLIVLVACSVSAQGHSAQPSPSTV
jgi:hypothetical protein